MLNRKNFSILLTFVLLFAMISACAPAATPEAEVVEPEVETEAVEPAAETEEIEVIEEEEVVEEVEPEASKPYEGQTVTVLLEDTPWHHGVEKTAPAWADEMGIDLVLEFLPEVQEREKMDLDLTTGTGLYDVFLTDEMYIAKVAQLGALEPIEPFIEADNFDLSDFPPLGLETLTHGGHLYGIPWRTAMNQLFYRKDILDKYGIAVPETYDELYDAAVEVQQKLREDGVEDVYGITARGLRGEGLNMWIVGSSVLPAFGAKWFDDSGKPQVNSPEFVEAIAYYAKLLQDAGPPDAPAMSWDDCSKFYEAGKAVFYIDSGIQLSLMKDRGSDVAVNSEAALIPIGPAGTRHTGMYVPAYVMAKTAKNKEAAWEFMKFATSYEQMLMDAVEGDNFEIARASVVESAEFAERFPYPGLNEVQVASMQYAQEERPMIVEWPQMGDIVGAALQSVIAGEKEAQEAMDEAQAEIEAIFE
jgi:multiple sugar transport system substrate-binding protein